MNVRNFLHNMILLTVGPFCEKNPAHVPFWRVNNPTLGEFCFTMIGRADIEGSKSDVAKNAWPPQASYPCGNYSDTSNLRFLMIKGSLGPSFEVSISTEYQNQESFYPYVLHEISVLIELSLGHLCCLLTDVPPQPNSPTDNVFNLNLEITSLIITNLLDWGKNF